MYRTLCLPLLAALAACSSSDGSVSTRNDDTACSVTGQKQFVLDVAREAYLWNGRLPASIDLDRFATPGAVLLEVMSFSPPISADDDTPVDRFGSIGSAQADREFFGEGLFEGFGFGFRWLADDDFRITRVFADSPAAAANLARGQRFLALGGVPIADIVAADPVNGFADALDASPLLFTMQPPEGEPFEVEIAQGIVTIDPLPQSRLIERADGTQAGYIEMTQFISTADAELETIFDTLSDASVTDLILDLRYNGGGLVSTTNLFGDYLGGIVAENLPFSEVRFNADRSAENTIRRFNRLGNSIALSRLVVIATSATASASEMIANGMAPHVEVTIVGDDTFGKPVGQEAFLFCEQVLRLTSFQLFNADGFGDYFNGLPVDCPAADDLDTAVGAEDDPNMIAAFSILDTGACPPAAAATRSPDFKMAVMRAPQTPQELVDVR